MRSGLLTLVVMVLLVVSGGVGLAQEPDARTLLQTALKAMGGENLKSIQYSGSTGYVAAVGQNYSPARPTARSESATAQTKRGGDPGRTPAW